MIETPQEELFDHFEQVLFELQEIKDKSVRLRNDPNGIRKLLQRIVHLYYFPHSNLTFLFSKVSNAKIKSPGTFVESMNSLIVKYGFSHELFLMYDNEYVQFNSDSKALKLALESFYPYYNNNDLQDLLKTYVKSDHDPFAVESSENSLSFLSDFRQYTQSMESINHIPDRGLEELILETLKCVFKSIKANFLHRLLLMTEVTNERIIASLNNDAYVQKWIDGTVTIYDIKRNSNVDYWEIIYLKNVSFEKMDEIENLQNTIFHKEVQRELQNKIEEIDEIPFENKMTFVHNQKRILERFFSGDLDELLIQRVKEIMPFDIPLDVVLKYDLILSNPPFINRLKQIYFPILYKEKSSIFVAQFFFEYLKYLSNYSLEERKITAKKQKTVQKPIRKSFGFIGNIDNLRTVLYELADKINLLYDKLEFNELFSLMTSDDYRNEKYHIRIGCETVQFAYITGRLAPFFKQFKPIDIEASKAFFSKLNDKQILARDIHGKQDADVKSREEIDKIISHLK